MLGGMPGLLSQFRPRGAEPLFGLLKPAHQLIQRLLVGIFPSLLASQPFTNSLEVFD